jgi:hypothetical protein
LNFEKLEARLVNVTLSATNAKLSHYRLLWKRLKYTFQVFRVSLLFRRAKYVSSYYFLLKKIVVCRNQEWICVFWEKPSIIPEDNLGINSSTRSNTNLLASLLFHFKAIKSGSTLKIQQPYGIHWMSTQRFFYLTINLALALLITSLWYVRLLTWSLYWQVILLRLTAIYRKKSSPSCWWVSRYCPNDSQYFFLRQQSLRVFRL